MSLESKLLAKLTDPNEIARVWDMGLKAEVFEDPICQYVYGFITDYWLSSQMKVAPTPFVIEEEVPGFKLEDDTDTESWWLVEKLTERYARNGLHDMMIEAGQMAQQGENPDPVRALKWLQTEVYNANQTISPRHSRSDMSNYEARRERYRLREEGGEVGMPLGIEELDEHTGSVLPGELAAIGAFSKVGKTMMLVKAASAARLAGYKPIFYTLEMPVSEIEDRIDAMISGVSYDRMSRRKLGPKELEEMHAMQVALDEMGGIMIESPPEGERTVANLTARARHSGADYMLIDQLSFMEESTRTNSEKQRLGGILKQLKNEIGNAARGKLSCFMACQLNRESLERTDGPLLKDFADAAEVERTCDLLLALSRNQQQRSNRTMRLDILGGRRCETAKWLLNWDLIDRSHISVLERITRSSS
jgi:replicative DNA helicase